jgi:hypothetical protein
MRGECPVSILWIAVFIRCLGAVDGRRLFLCGIILPFLSEFIVVGAVSCNFITKPSLPHFLPLLALGCGCILNF